MRVLFLMTLTLLVLGVVVSSTALAGVGVGIVAGEPSGFSFKWWDGGETAIDAVTGWSLGDGDFYAHADYLWHRVIEDKEIPGSVPLYFGVGARLLLRDEEDSKIGVRIPIGLDYLFEDGRFDVFIEIAPVFNIVPDTEFDLTGGIGARYYF